MSWELEPDFSSDLGAKCDANSPSVTPILNTTLAQCWPDLDAACCAEVQGRVSTDMGAICSLTCMVHYGAKFKSDFGIF